MSFRSFVKFFIPKRLFGRIEPWGHLAEGILLNLLHGFPARRLKVIGVTGTNGKTTTCFLIQKMLHEAGYQVGMMTTVAYGVGANIQAQAYHMTSVSMPTLMRRIKAMRSEGIEWLVLETTSHALAQNRVWGIPYTLAVMTNVTHEHLDWHGSFVNYRDAKRKLFKITNHHARGLRTGVINADDPSAPLFAQDIARVIQYGITRGDLRASGIKLSDDGSQFTAAIEKTKYQINCHLPGSFNVYNALAAVAVGHVLGLSKAQVENGVAALASVEGRMQTVDVGQDFQVIVDFAHTPDAFEKLFKDVKKLARGRIIALFGSAGRRDEAKRAVQGKLAGQYADEVVITEEDDRDVDGQEIMEQIAAGAEAAGKIRDQDLFLIHDRTGAISFALSRARTGDMVLLLGKGHEKTIERTAGQEPWDEIATAKAALGQLAKR